MRLILNDRPLAKAPTTVLGTVTAAAAVRYASISLPECYLVIAHRERHRGCYAMPKTFIFITSRCCMP